MYSFLSPKPGQKFLDIGCGTGNYTIALNQKGFALTGVDPSSEMLEKAQAKSSEVIWQLGNAEQLDFEDNSFDGALASLTLHHWNNLEKGFKEIDRVLKPGASFLIFTSSPEQTASFWLKHYFPIMIQNSVDVMPKLTSIKENLCKYGFQIMAKEKYYIQDDLQDHFLNCGKNKPELYLNPEIRQGISSFSAFANQEEVEKGLVQLEKDIQSNRIQEVIEQHENTLGDYLFILAQK
jgi:ubiquinone/menaquinone biosynthesis C-methylase UbiE